MNGDFFNNITSTLDTIGNFLFSSYLGTGILVVSCLFLSFLIALILEFKTHEKYKNHPIEDEEEADEDE